MTLIVSSLDEIADRYDAIFCDLWGCLHNGLRAYPVAVTALRRFRARGGAVLLITNAPRPAPGVAVHLDQLGVPRDCWDAITSSGDAAQAALGAGDYGTRVYHIGPARDLPFFTDMAPDIRPVATIERVALSEAEGIVCTGLFDDETETPEDYRATIHEGVARRLPMLCVNPDVYVDRGPRRIWCAGGIAEAYARAGGVAHYYGKPHPPIYELARRRLAALGHAVEDAGILCIGDGITTDIAGGIGENLDTLFVTGGLAHSEIGGDPENPDPERLRAYLARHGFSPTTAIGRLR
ncbi:MAG TPA: TIGR01459 family HAD-type hydrolase [Paracoccaceae bacterium]|nr:TIGR01459 family HAD-type hydrolase [Paracoccaceae bacterium]